MPIEGESELCFEKKLKSKFVARRSRNMKFYVRSCNFYVGHLVADVLTQCQNLTVKSN